MRSCSSRYFHQAELEGSQQGYCNMYTNSLLVYSTVPIICHSLSKSFCCIQISSMYTTTSEHRCNLSNSSGRAKGIAVAEMGTELHNSVGMYQLLIIR